MTGGSGPAAGQSGPGEPGEIRGAFPRVLHRMGRLQGRAHR